MPGFDDALKAALSGEVAPEVTETAQEVVETPPAEEVSPSEPVAVEQETPAEAAQRARDEAGRFAKQEAKPQTAPKQGVEKTTTTQLSAAAKPAETTPAAGSAPRSWAPAVREHWEKIPREARDAILKREGEASRAISELGQARRFQQEFEAVAAPYKALFTAPPVQVAANLFQTAAALQTGDVPTKAGIIATMIRNFGVSPDAVADALEGKTGGQQQAPQGAPVRDPRVDELLRRQQEMEQRTQQAQLSEAQRALQEFEASAEFLEDVREDMAVLLETGRAKTYEEAYRKACAMNEDVGRVMAQRKAQEASRTQSQQAKRAQYAASSVRSDPAPPAGSRKPSFDDALAAAIRGG
jgi:hypothetical protein